MYRIPAWYAVMTCQGSRLCTTTLWNILEKSLYEFSMPSGENEVTYHFNIVSCFPFTVSHPFLWSVLIYISKNYENKEKALKRPFQHSHKKVVSWRFQIFSYTHSSFYLSRGLKRQPGKDGFANYHLIILNKSQSLCFLICTIWQPFSSKKCVLIWDSGAACK